MSIFENNILSDKIKNYLHGEIDNPILKKVIEEEFIYSENIETIIKTYFSDIIKSENYDEKLQFLSNLIKNVSKDNYNILKTQLCKSFIELSSDEHLFLIINNNENINNIFKMMCDNSVIGDILKHILSGLSISMYKDEYIIKCIETCQLINLTISMSIIDEYLNSNSADLISNEKLMAYFIKYIANIDTSIYLQYEIIRKVSELIQIKISSTLDHINKLPLNNMMVAFEIYKLGKIIIDSNVHYNYKLIDSLITTFTPEQLEYIVKSIHTCIINNNISQAQTILAIVFYFEKTQIIKFMEYYNKWLLVRISSNKFSLDEILSNEYNLWNINKEYKKIMEVSVFSNYLQIMNNIRYTIVINNDLSKISIKNSDVYMNRLMIKLVNKIDLNDNENFNHHSKINDYLKGLDKYIENRSSLQSIHHDMNKSKILINTEFGKINCSLIIGSILLHLNDSDMTLKSLIEKMNIKEEKLLKLINSLIINNIIIQYEKDLEKITYYKYVTPFGQVDIDENNTILTKPVVEIGKFTDINTTMDSRIIKEVKPQKLNLLELERRVQEFMGSSYDRNIFYQRIESLKNRFFIEDKNSLIEYLV
jgi:hypothetical protein